MNIIIESGKVAILDNQFGPNEMQRKIFKSVRGEEQQEKGKLLHIFECKKGVYEIYKCSGVRDQNEHEVYGYVIALRNKKFDPNNIGFMTKSYI